VEDYLRTQGRFAHLFEPRRNDEMLARIQAEIDAYWAAAI
jgi:pyruvate ferredoxin oxidoreductase beta subunit